MLSNNSEENAQNKLLLMYILKMSPNPLTNDKLTEFILDKNYMNYFSLQQYISELIDNEFIEETKENNSLKYKLLNPGEVSLELFQSKISEEIINELSNEFKLQQIVKIRETQVLGEYYPKENNQFAVNLKLVENEEPLFSLYLDVASEEQGEKFCNIWKENTEIIYQSIINLFIKNDTKVG